MGEANGVSVKEAVLPFNRFRRVDGKGVDSVLGPEMKSTGEVMGVAPEFGTAYAKSQIAAFGPLPRQGSVFVSLSYRDKESAIDSIKALIEMGFAVLTTEGTNNFLKERGISTILVPKHGVRNYESGQRSAVDLINEGKLDLVINTPLGRGARRDGWLIRSAAVARGISCITTVAGFKAAIAGIRALKGEGFAIKSIQEWIAS